MKIYFDPPESIDTIEEQFNSLAIGADPTLIPILTPLINFCNQAYAQKSIYFLELIKYKVMWALRFLESDIENESKEGFFRIKNNGSLEMDGFSPELMEKIKQEMKDRFKK